MTNSTDLLLDVVQESLNVFQSIKTRKPDLSRSNKTKAEYLRLAKYLIERGRSGDDGLVKATLATSRASTFFKRMAALRYFCAVEFYQLACELEEVAEDATADRLSIRYSDLLGVMRSVATLQSQGLTQPRSRRQSKRKALTGLPAGWRTELCVRGEQGKYRTALLVSALAGVRPAELATGTNLWIAWDEQLQKDVLHIQVNGAKVKEGQGQPSRTILYDAQDASPLVAKLSALVGSTQEKRLFVQIDHSGNFSKEVARLARSLWPALPHSITASCFRHQFAADLKAVGDGETASKGLGHRSSKTRRYYGTANQACRSEAITPVRVVTELPVMPYSQFSQPASSRGVAAKLSEGGAQHGAGGRMS